MRVNRFRWLLLVALAGGLITIACKKKEKEGLIVLVWTSGPSSLFSREQIIWGFKVVNGADSTAYDVSLTLNNERKPFYRVDSIVPHTILEVSRWEYKPKIFLADTVTISYRLAGRKQATESENPLNYGQSLKGDWKEGE